jgi:hypothetical protein
MQKNEQNDVSARDQMDKEKKDLISVTTRQATNMLRTHKFLFRCLPLRHVENKRLQNDAGLYCDAAHTLYRGVRYFSSGTGFTAHA